MIDRLWCPMHQSRLEVADDCHDSAMVQVVVLCEIQLHEDVGHVLLDRAEETTRSSAMALFDLP